MMPELAAFRRLTVRFSLVFLACGLADGSFVLANQDALTTGPSHEPTAALYVHLATAMFTTIAGLVFLLRDWVKRHHIRPAEGAHGLHELVASLAVQQGQQARDIADIRSALSKVKDEVIESVHAEVQGIRESVDRSISHSSTLVTIAKEQLRRLEEAEKAAREAEKRADARSRKGVRA